MIIDGGIVSAQGFSGLNGDPRAYLMACYPKATIPPVDRSGETEPMVARVNHGVWIASCSCGAPGLPRPGCIVFLDDAFGWCLRCGNAACGGKWRPIILPPPEERERIEAVLLCRLRSADRNWEPEETLADLLAQNIEHGEPVPEGSRAWLTDRR